MTKKVSKVVTVNTVFKILRIVLLCILIFVSLSSLGIAYFTLNNPQLVSDRLRYLVPSVTPAPIAMKGMAILGDSQSDEYRADDWRGGNYADTTRNWVELLTKYRGIDVGEWGSWGEPRRNGYSQNWARTGATAHSLIKSGQHIGAAEQIKEGKLNVVVIYVGALDLAPYVGHGNYEAIYNGDLSEAGKKIIIHRIIADIQTAVYTLEDAGDVRVLLVKIPDWGNHLGVKIAFPMPQQRLLVTNTVNETNEKLEEFAQEEHLLTLDPNAVYSDLFKKSDKGQFIVDGVVINRVMVNNNPDNFYLEDGIHTGTVVNGFIANAIIDKLNTVLTKKIKPFTEKEIRESAGL